MPDSLNDAPNQLDGLSRLIAEQHGQNPDGIYYPVPGNRTVQWPTWQAYRDHARQILTFLGIAHD